MWSKWPVVSKQQHAFLDKISHPCWASFCSVFVFEACFFQKKDLYDSRQHTALPCVLYAFFFVSSTQAYHLFLSNSPIYLLSFAILLYLMPEMCSLPSCLLLFCTHYFNSRCPHFNFFRHINNIILWDKGYSPARKKLLNLILMKVTGRVIVTKMK